MVVAASCLEETWHHSYGEAWWWQHHAAGMVFSGRDCGRLVWIEGKMNGEKYREILNENLLPECSGPQTGVKGHLPTGQRP
jgi:hypothetical protein